MVTRYSRKHTYNRFTVLLTYAKHIHTDTHNRFMALLDFVRDYPGKPVPEHTQHTTVLLLVWHMSGSTRVSRYQKGKTKKVKTNLDLLEQEIVSGSGISWAMCKSAP